MARRSILSSQPFPTLIEEVMKVVALVVWIRPATALPTEALIKQRHFRKDAAAQIDAMVAILCRRQHKFGFG